MNAADRKAARKAILQDLRRYAKAVRSERIARANRAGLHGTRDYEWQDAARTASHLHSLCLGAMSFAHSVRLIEWREYERFSERLVRIIYANVTRGIPAKQPEAVSV